MHHKKHDKKTIFIGLAVLIALTVVILPTSGKTVTFDIPDKCGRFVNLISHTIETESSCSIRCEQQCKAKGLEYKQVEFTKAEQGCHTCSCQCQEPLWEIL